MAVRYPIVLVGTTLQELPAGDSIVGSIANSDNAALANNLSNGTAGSIPYQISPNNTSFLTIGSNGNVLTSNGTAPIWAPISSLSTASSGVSNNIFGGAAGSIPYQTNISTTTFLPIGPNNSLLVSNGLTPQWISQSTLSVSSATTAVSATTAGSATTATNLASGAQGGIPYQSNTSTTTFLPIGPNNSLLVSNGTTPQWVSQSTLSVSSATTAVSATTAGSATNLLSGAQGSIPYQTGPGTTSFLSIGTNGYVLTSNGTTPTWEAVSSISAGSALTSTNLASGAQGGIPYQVAAGSTTFLPIGAENFVLSSSGSLPQWVSVSTLVSGNATNADFLLVGSNYRAATVDSPSTGTANSIAARDSQGNLNAVVFQGESTAAQLADLAEKYVPDQTYDVGTVVSIGGEAEITASKSGDRAIGVISNNPAFKMNSNLENGVYVALKGRVPVKVLGPVNKGEKLISADNGVAIVDNNSINFFAIAIESNQNSDLKLLECLVL